MDLVGVVAAFAITGGLLLLVLRLLKRLHAGGAPTGVLPLDVLDRKPLGPKQGLLLVRVGERVLLLATGDQGVRLITEVRGDDRDRILAPAARGGDRTRADHEFRRLLGRLTLALALTLTAAPAGAQSASDSARGVVPVGPVLAPAPTARTAVVPQGPVAAPAVPGVDVRIGQGPEQVRLSGTVGLVVFLGALTLLPAVVLLMTSFTRILVVLHFLRSAIGTQGSPPGQLLVAIAVLLTGVVMHPVLDEVNRTALQPYLEGRLPQNEAYRAAVEPFRRFMLGNVRDKDLATFTELAGVAEAGSIDEVPTLTIVSAFVTSELQTAFWMGFVIFLPFVVVDLVVATSLMSLGMFMVPPVMISLPFKLLLFVLADGWSLVAQNLVASFHR